MLSKPVRLFGRILVSFLFDEMMLARNPAKTLRQLILALSEDERHEFAEKVGTSDGHLRQIYRGFRTCSSKTAVEIDKATNGLIKADWLRPDTDFEYIRQQAIEQALRRDN